MASKPLPEPPNAESAQFPGDLLDSSDWRGHYPGALWTLAQETGKIYSGVIEQAAVIADVPIPPEAREMMLAGLTNQAKGYEEIFQLHIDNSVQPSCASWPSAHLRSRPPARSSRSNLARLLRQRPERAGK